MKQTPLSHARTLAPALLIGGALTLCASALPGSARGQSLFEGKVVNGCGTLTASDSAPRATFPKRLVWRKSAGSLRLYLHDVSQKTGATARVTIRGRNVWTNANGYTCSRRGSESLISFRLSSYGRRALRRSPRPTVRVALTMTNGSGKSRTITRTFRVRVSR